MVRDLSRLLRPRSVAVIGGGVWCENVVQQCREAQRQIGFTRWFVDRFEGDRLLKNRQRVLVDVFMVMLFVRFKAQ